MKKDEKTVESTLEKIDQNYEGKIHRVGGRICSFTINSEEQKVQLQVHSTREVLLEFPLEREINGWSFCRPCKKGKYRCPSKGRSIFVSTDIYLPDLNDRGISMIDPKLRYMILKSSKVATCLSLPSLDVLWETSTGGRKLEMSPCGDKIYILGRDTVQLREVLTNKDLWVTKIRLRNNSGSFRKHFSDSTGLYGLVCARLIQEGDRQGPMTYHFLRVEDGKLSTYIFPNPLPEGSINTIVQTPLGEYMIDPYGKVLVSNEEESYLNSSTCFLSPNRNNAIISFCSDGRLQLAVVDLRGSEVQKVTECGGIYIPPDYQVDQETNRVVGHYLFHSRDTQQPIYTIHHIDFPPLWDPSNHFTSGSIFREMVETFYTLQLCQESTVYNLPRELLIMIIQRI